MFKAKKALQLHTYDTKRAFTRTSKFRSLHRIFFSYISAFVCLLCQLLHSYGQFDLVYFEYHALTLKSIALVDNTRHVQGVLTNFHAYAQFKKLTILLEHTVSRPIQCNF